MRFLHTLLALAFIAGAPAAEAATKVTVTRTSAENLCLNRVAAQRAVKVTDITVVSASVNGTTYVFVMKVQKYNVNYVCQVDASLNVHIVVQ